jgi:uncharacterized membrane protein YqjE
MSTETPTTYKELVELAIEIINLLIVAIFTILFVYFIWKTIDSWILHAGDEKKRAEGKQYALTAIIALVMMIVIWGVVKMIKETLFG